MKYKVLSKTILYFAFLMTGTARIHAYGDPADTLKLQDAVNLMLSQYPTIKMATEALNASDARIRIARSGYLPNIDASASYTRIGPVPSFDFPDFGRISLYPENNFVAGINIDQNIYDFGRTSKKVAVEQQGKTLTEENIDIVKNQLTLRFVYVYYSLLYAQEAVAIKEQQIENLREHLAFVEKKKETGSSTDYEVLSTQVRLTATESQKTELVSSGRVLLALLNSFLVRPENTAMVPARNTDVAIQQEVQDSAITRALNNRPEVKLADDRIKLMQLNIGLARTSNYPSLRAYASGGGKNGYVPDIDKFHANYTAGIGLRIPIYDASRTKNSVSLAQSSLMTSQHQKDLTALEITNEVVSYYQKVASALTLVDQNKGQVKQAERAYALANTSYQSGVITNLDLLDATTSLSESRLSLLKARIDLLISYYQLQIAEGRNLF